MFGEPINDKLAVGGSQTGSNMLAPGPSSILVGGTDRIEHVFPDLGPGGGGWCEQRI